MIRQELQLVGIYEYLNILVVVMDAQKVENRGKICDDCDLRHGFLPVCTKCGCVIPAKIRLENQKCPIGKW